MKHESNAGRRGHAPATLAAAAALALCATPVLAEHDRYYPADAAQPAPQRCPTQHVHHHYHYPQQPAAYYAPPAPQYGQPYQGPDRDQYGTYHQRGPRHAVPAYAAQPYRPSRHGAYGRRGYGSGNGPLGGVVGAAVGGYIGSQFGGGSGQLASTAAGSIAGFLVGRGIGNRY